MITVANRLYVKPEHAEAFEKVFRERAGLVDGMPGFLSNSVLRPVNEGEPYVVLTMYTDKVRVVNFAYPFWEELWQSHRLKCERPMIERALCSGCAPICTRNQKVTNSGS